MSRKEKVALIESREKFCATCVSFSSRNIFFARLSATLKKRDFLFQIFYVFEVQFLQQQTGLNIVFAVIALGKLGFRAITSLIFPLNFPFVSIQNNIARH